MKSGTLRLLLFGDYTIASASEIPVDSLSGAVSAVISMLSASHACDSAVACTHCSAKTAETYTNSATSNSTHYLHENARGDFRWYPHAPAGSEPATRYLAKSAQGLAEQDPCEVSRVN